MEKCSGFEFGIHTHKPGNNSAGESTGESADVCSLLRGCLILKVKFNDVAS